MPPKSLLFHNQHRTATWLELFFDLIFVVVVSKITHLLAHTHHGHLEPGLWWKFPLMLLPIWWIWMLHTVWANLYDSDNKPHRVSTLILMLLMVILSTQMITDWEKSYWTFNIAYFAVRLVLALLFILNNRRHDHAFGRQRGIATLIGALISLSSGFFPPPLRYGIFWLGLGIDLLYPIWLARRGQIPPIHNHHFVERMGLLIIILMGESVITLSAGMVDIHWDTQTTIAALSGALMIGLAWWIYFDSYHRLADPDAKPETALALAYPHFLTCLGLALIANVIHHAIHPELARKEYQIMAISGMIVFYIGKQIPYFAKFPPLRHLILINTTITFALCGLSLLLPSNALILAGQTAALLTYVALNYATVIRKMRALETPAPA